MGRPAGKPTLNTVAPVRTPGRKRLETLPYDVADDLVTAADVVYFLEAALELNDPAFFQKALGTAARARGMQQIARSTGTTRAGLYKALSEHGNPEFGTLVRVLDALGLRFTLSAKREPRKRAPTTTQARPRRREVAARSARKRR